MPNLKQHVKTNSRNIGVTVVSDYPSFDVIVNGEKYETYPQNSETTFDDYGTIRSNGSSRKVQNTNALQRVIRDRMYSTAERLQDY